MFKRGENKKAQIWVETVIYTLIALVMIGTVLAVVKPKIEESQDRAVIEQSMALLKNIDSVIFDIKSASGNQRIIEISIKKGKLIIDGKSDKIIFEIESRHEYSEPGQDIKEGSSEIIVHTQKLGKFNKVTLTRDYSEEYNITYIGDDELKTLTNSPTPFKMTLLNEGRIKIEDTTSTCTPSNVETDCIDSNFSVGFSKSCVNGKCRYTREKLKINVDIN